MRHKWLITVLVAMAFWGISGPLRSDQEHVVIDTPRFLNTKDISRIIFDLPKDVDFSYFTLPDPARFVIDIRNASYQGTLPDPARLGPHVLNMRDGVSAKKRLRMVFDLTTRVESRAFLMPARNNKPARLVIDLVPVNSRLLTQLSQSEETLGSAGKSAPASVAADPPAKLTQKPVPTKKAQPAVPVTPREVYTPQNSTQPVVIAIDPGHGGVDPGAIGQKGRFEKQLVLQIGKRLGKLINAAPGLQAILTREDDSFVSLRDRTARARDASAELFISLHADAWKTANASGTSIYALSRSGASSEAARWLADKENAVDLVGGVSLNDKDALVAEVLLDLSINRAINDGTEFAKDLLLEFEPLGKLHGKKVERAGFVVLKSPDMASVLIELGFITNPNDERRLSDPKHQQRIAAAIFHGIQRYLDRRPRTAKQPPVSRRANQG